MSPCDRTALEEYRTRGSTSSPNLIWWMESRYRMTIRGSAFLSGIIEAARNTPISGVRDCRLGRRARRHCRGCGGRCSRPPNASDRALRFLGGTGRNGGIHDAVNLTGRIAAVWNGGASETCLDDYDLQRRSVTIEFVQRQTIQNKANLEAKDLSAYVEYRNRMQAVAQDAALRRKHLLDISMVSSLNRAKEFTA